MNMAANLFNSAKNFFGQKKIQEIILLCIIMGTAFFAVFVILHNADWILGDNYSFVLTTAQGKPAPLLNGANIGNSRFFPLAGLDFNLLLFIPGGTSALGHYIYVALSFVIAYLLYFLFNKELFAGRGNNNALYITALSCLLLVANSGFFTVFMNVIFSERMIFLLFAFMMFSFLSGRNCGKPVWFVLAAAAAIYAAYLKETVSPALSAFSAFSLLFFRKEMPAPEKYAHYAITANFIVFMALWLCLGHKGSSGTYHSDEILPVFQMLYAVLWQHKIYLCILAAAFLRLCAVFFFRLNPVRMADSLLLASAAFICEYLMLKFTSDYYYFPAAVLGIPALLYFVFSSWNGVNAGRRPIPLGLRIASLCLIVLSFAGEIPLAAANIKAALSERAKVMPGLRMMAEKYASGGKIYWFQPWDKEKKIFNLTELYINFILNQEMGYKRGQKDSVLTIAETVPELGENDIFLYMVLHDGKFSADSITLTALKEQNFAFCQFQTGYLVFTKGKCGLLK